jgi:DNA repair protein RadC
MALKDLPADTRPREKLLTRGAASLSDSELLALLLRTGTAGRGVLQMADDVLGRFNGLAGLLHARVDDLKLVKGLGGTAKRAQLAAVLELARRALVEEMKARDSLASPAAVRAYLRLRMQDLGHECFYGVFLDAQNRVIVAEELFRGTLTQTSVYPREVVKHALRHNAAAIILAHNHPSGVAEPSLQDQALTRTLAEALALVDVKVLDHFIVAPGAAMSFAERGLL